MDMDEDFIINDLARQVKLEREKLELIRQEEIKVYNQVNSIRLSIKNSYYIIEKLEKAIIKLKEDS